MLSLAGVPLIAPTKEIADWIGANVTQREAFNFLPRSWPGARLTGVAFPTGHSPAQPVKVGTLTWPAWGASRFATGYFLASAAQATTLRAAAFGADGTGFNLVTLRMDSPGSRAAETLKTDVYLMPLTPLSGWRKVNGLYLATVVDDRYWWGQKSYTCSIGPSTSWDDLFAIAEGLIGTPIIRGAIAPAYVRPHASLSMNEECLGIALDAIAFNCGLRVVRKLDGTVHAMDYPTAAATLDAQLAVKARTVLAGGSRYLDSL